MPTIFGKQSRQTELINNLDQEFIKIRQRYQLAPGDFPNVEKFKQGLKLYKFERFHSLKPHILEKAEDVCYFSFSYISLTCLLKSQLQLFLGAF